MKSEWLSPAAFERLFDFMQYENIVAMRVSLETGLRIGDVLELRRRDIIGCKIRYKAQKTGKEGVKTISKELKRRLDAIMPHSDDEYIFRGRRGGHRTRQAVWQDIRKACRKAGLDVHVSPHSARKAYAVRIRDEQGLEAAQRELQHDKLSTTMLYAFSDLAIKKDCAEAPNWDRVAELIADRVIEKLKKFLTSEEMRCTMTEP